MPHRVGGAMGVTLCHCRAARGTRFDINIKQDLKNIKNVKGCRDGMPKTMQTR